MLLGVPFQLCLALAVALMLNEIRFLEHNLSHIVFLALCNVDHCHSVGLPNALISRATACLMSSCSLVSLPQQPFLNSPKQALPSVLALVVWQGMGFAVIIFLAGLKQIPRTIL